MLDQIETIFENRAAMMKKLKKESYAKNMTDFKEAHGHFFEEMTEYVGSAEDKTAAAREVGKIFAEKNFQFYSKNGKMNGRTQADLNLFMVYYVFPTILLTEHERADEICQQIRKAWNQTFPKCNINYTDFETLYNSFRHKIFGIF